MASSVLRRRPAGLTRVHNNLNVFCDKNRTSLFFPPVSHPPQQFLLGILLSLLLTLLLSPSYHYLWRLRPGLHTQGPRRRAQGQYRRCSRAVPSLLKAHAVVPQGNTVVLQGFMGGGWGVASTKCQGRPSCCLVGGALVLCLRKHTCLRVAWFILSKSDSSSVSVFPSSVSLSLSLSLLQRVHFASSVSPLTLIFHLIPSGSPPYFQRSMLFPSFPMLSSLWH